MTGPVQLVWYRRDLRAHDHAPLLRAARRGPVLPLFVADPAWARSPDFGPRHWTFARDGLRELRAALAALGQPLVVRSGPIVPVLNALHEVAPLAALWTHAETGRAPVAARTEAARDWAAARGIPFHELSQDGVARGAGGRGRWAGGWLARLGTDPLPAPDALRPVPDLAPGAIPTHQALGLPPDDRPAAPEGGRAAGKTLLDSFLAARGHDYPAALDDPLRAPDASSRLGPHLAWGTLSARQIVAACRAVEGGQEAVSGEQESGRSGPQSSVLSPQSSALVARLRARDRAVQRLHDDPGLASAALHPVLDALYEEELPILRDGPDRAERLDAWRAGATGFPLADAAMRQLRATGWLPYPLRALVVGVATQLLWLPPRLLDPLLARQWLDYEPGVHLDQLRHHAGIGPAAPPRPPDPVALGHAHDRAGAYARRWLPALRALPDDYLHQPWLLDPAEQARLGCVVGRDYPAPLVADEVARAARAALAAARRRPEVAAALAAARARLDSGPAPAQQLTLF